MRLVIAALMTLTLYAVFIIFKNPLKHVFAKTIGKLIVKISDPWVSFRRKRHQEKLDRRIAAGSDRYFEELRTLQAYDPDTPSIQPPQSVFQKVSFDIFVFAIITFQIYKIISE